jgi:hypothetical protein
MTVPPVVCLAAAVASLPRDVNGSAGGGGGASLFVPAVALLLIPVVARILRSIAVAVALFVATVLVVVVTAADMCSSPVVLVWASIVPLAAFSTLPTRGVFVASTAAAVAVFAADARSTIVTVADATLGLHAVSVPVVMPYYASPSVVIASWVIFLGLFGVLQRQVHAIVAMDSGLRMPRARDGASKQLDGGAVTAARLSESQRGDSESESEMEGLVPSGLPNDPRLRRSPGSESEACSGSESE